MRSGDPVSPVPDHLAVPLARSRRVVARLVAVVCLAFATATPATAAARTTGIASDWQATTLGLPQAWQLTQGTASTIVAIVDTGVAADHPALAGRVLPGYDFVNHEVDARDDNGHGTATAGVVVSACPDCRILPVKVLAANLTGDWNTIAAGVTWAADHGAGVINLSIGAPRAPDALAAAIAYALAKGVIVVAAAGNDGQNEPFYPAMYPGVVSVAGIEASGARYRWSNYGSWVTVAAPGCATAPTLGGGYDSDFCGTSTAAPFVAGVAGLARSLDPSLTPAQFANEVAATSDPLPDPTTAGGGSADAGRLLRLLDVPRAAPVAAAAPTMAHAPATGTRLTALLGAWRDAASYVVRWQRSRGGAHWHDIATGMTYTPLRGDVGYRLRIVVTAANSGGSTSAISAPSAPVRQASSRHGGSDRSR